MGFSLAIGLVIDFGGLLGQTEGSGGSTESSGGGGDGGLLSSVADTIGGMVDERRMIRVPLSNIPKAIRTLRHLPWMVPSLAFASETAGGGKPWYQSLALYIGPVIDLSFLYVTVGICLGGFGCLAGGGGLKIGNFGFGVLFPFWKWW